MIEEYVIYTLINTSRTFRTFIFEEAVEARNYFLIEKQTPCWLVTRIRHEKR